MKIYKIVIVLLGIFSSVSVHAEIADRIVAVVNSDVITASELNNAFEPLRKRIEASYDGTDKAKIIAENRLALLNKLIENTLIDQEAKKAGMVIREEEITEAIKDLLSRRKITMDDLIYELAKENITIEEYRMDVKSHLLRIRLIRRQIKSKITITDDEIGEYYRKQRETYEGTESVRLKQILMYFPKDANEKVKAKLRAEMDALHKRLKNGEPFDLVAMQYSKGSPSVTGGDIGFVEKGSMHPAVDRVAFHLKTGEMSDVIESPAGFHIITVIDRRGAGIKPIESVREEIKAKLEEEKVEKKYEEWIGELRKKSIIEIRR